MITLGITNILKEYLNHAKLQGLSEEAALTQATAIFFYVLSKQKGWERRGLKDDLYWFTMEYIKIYNDDANQE